MTVCGIKIMKFVIVIIPKVSGLATLVANACAKTTDYVLWEATVPPTPVSNAFVPVIPNLWAFSVMTVIPSLTPLILRSAKVSA